MCRVRMRGTQLKGLNSYENPPRILPFARFGLASVRRDRSKERLNPMILAPSAYANPKALVYDFMEPLRPLVDREILKFALSHTFAPGDFTITKWGGCRLNPQLARVVASQAVGTAVRPIVAGLISSLLSSALAKATSTSKKRVTAPIQK